MDLYPGQKLSSVEYRPFRPCVCLQHSSLFSCNNPSLRCFPQQNIRISLVVVVEVSSLPRVELTVL